MQVELSSLLTAAEVAAKRGVCLRTIERDTASGKLESVKIGGGRCYTPEAVTDYLQRCRDSRQ